MQSQQNIIKENIDKIISPLSETVFYFEKPIHLVQYLHTYDLADALSVNQECYNESNMNNSNSKDNDTERKTTGCREHVSNDGSNRRYQITLHDIRRIQRAYIQTVDMKNIYTLLHWIPFMKPWPKSIREASNTLHDLLPENSYFPIDSHDLQFFKTNIIRNESIQISMVDQNGDIKVEFLIAVWRSMVAYRTQVIESSGHDINVPALLEKGLDFMSSYVINSQNRYVNISYNYWVMDARIEWIGTLSNIFNKLVPPSTLGSEKYIQYAGIRYLMRQDASLRDANDMEQFKFYSSYAWNLTANLFCQTRTFYNSLYNTIARKLAINGKVNLGLLEPHSIPEYCDYLPKATTSQPRSLPTDMRYGNYVSRISDRLILEVIEYLRHKQDFVRNVHDKDESLSAVICKKNGWQIYSIEKPKPGRGLLARDFFHNYDSGIQEIISCDHALLEEYKNFKDIYSRYDADAKYSSDGILYRSLFLCE